MTLSVGVIICTHLGERFGQLGEAIESLRRQTRTPDEVIVVVDGNSVLADQLTESRSDFTLVTLPVRSGLAVARNAGVASCSADIVLFLDDDAVADRCWVELLAAAIEEDGTLGASGRSEPIWMGPRPAWLADEFLWTVGCTYAGQPTTRARVRNVYGGCCGLRRELFTDLGGYDARLGRSPTSAGGGEEADLCLRAQARWPGHVFTYEPAAHIGHYVPVARLTARYILRRAFDEGKMKAEVARLHRGGLVPERRFARGLPRAIAKYLAQGLRGDRRGIASALGTAVLASAVLLGLAAAVLAPQMSSAVPLSSAGDQSSVGVPVA
jgi:glycosyltransferase involved in cell wall biosynthesis